MNYERYVEDVLECLDNIAEMLDNLRDEIEDTLAEEN